MAIARQFAATVGTSATVLEGTQFPSFILINNGATTVFIGDSAVTTSTGFPIAVGDVFSPSQQAHNSLTGKVADRLYGIVATGTEDVRILVQAIINA